MGWRPGADSWIAYSKVGTTPVYVEPFPDRGQPISVGEALADHPRWGGRDSELALYFVDEDALEEGMLTRVRLEVAETGLRVSAFEPLLSMLDWITIKFARPGERLTLRRPSRTFP